MAGLGSGAGGQASLLAKCKDQQKRIKVRTGRQAGMRKHFLG